MTLKIICSLIGCSLCFIGGYLFRMGTEPKKKYDDIMEVKTIDVSPKDRRKYND